MQIEYIWRVSKTLLGILIGAAIIVFLFAVFVVYETLGGPIGNDIVVTGIFTYIFLVIYYMVSSAAQIIRIKNDSLEIVCLFKKYKLQRSNIAKIRTIQLNPKSCEMLFILNSSSFMKKYILISIDWYLLPSEKKDVVEQIFSWSGIEKTKVSKLYELLNKS